MRRTWRLIDLFKWIFYAVSRECHITQRYKCMQIIVTKCVFFLFVNSLTEVEYSVERNEDKPLSVDEVGFVVVKTNSYAFVVRLRTS